MTVQTLIIKHKIKHQQIGKETKTLASECTKTFEVTIMKTKKKAKFKEMMSKIQGNKVLKEKRQGVIEKQRMEEKTV